MISAGTAIKRYCTWCLNGLSKDVCASESCPLFPVRSGGKVDKSNLKRIRERCLNCVGTNSSKDVSECKCTSCMLFNFRSGHSPNITEDTKQKARERIKNNPERLEKMKIAREKKELEKEKIERIKQILLSGE